MNLVEIRACDTTIGFDILLTRRNCDGISLNRDMKSWDHNTTISLAKSRVRRNWEQSPIWCVGTFHASNIIIDLRAYNQLGVGSPKIVSARQDLFYFPRDSPEIHSNERSEPSCGEGMLPPLLWSLEGRLPSRTVPISLEKQARYHVVWKTVLCW